MNAKTQARIDLLVQLYAATGAGLDACKVFRETVEQQLRAQDRDTRYACAEAVNALAGEQGELMANAAHQACINTQAV